MSTMRIVLNLHGFRKLRQSPGVQRDCRRRAEQIARAAGPGHAVESMVGATRARASVRTDTFEAARNESRHGTLSASIDAARR
jgi:hypothetical protein